MNKVLPIGMYVFRYVFSENNGNSGSLTCKINVRIAINYSDACLKTSVFSV